MAIRTREQLQIDQAALLAEYRAQRGVAIAPSVSVETVLVSTIGRVTSIVTSDATLGAHLVVQPQAFAGTPPAPSGAATATVVAYPTPDHVVTDYSVNEYVQLLTARGALLASRLA